MEMFNILTKSIVVAVAAYVVAYAGMQYIVIPVLEYRDAIKTWNKQQQEQERKLPVRRVYV